MVIKIGVTPIKYFLRAEGGRKEIELLRVRSDYMTNLQEVASDIGMEILPVIITPKEELMATYVKTLDGIVFTGGDLNIHPALYCKDIFQCGKRTASLAQNIKEERKILRKYQMSRKEVDSTGRVDFEIELFKEFFALAKPTMGICLGMEIMNVAKGGTLESVLRRSNFTLSGLPEERNGKQFEVSDGTVVQEDLLNQTENNKKSGPFKVAGQTIRHFKKKTYVDAISIFHDVHFCVSELSNKGLQPILPEIKNEKTGTFSRKIVGKVTTNSAHSQRVAKCGENFVPVGFSPDGSIESIMHTEHPFALGVQWHPELMYQNPYNTNSQPEYNPTRQFLLSIGQKLR